MSDDLKSNSLLFLADLLRPSVRQLASAAVSKEEEEEGTRRSLCGYADEAHVTSDRVISLFVSSAYPQCASSPAPAQTATKPRSGGGRRQAERQRRQRTEEKKEDS
jgi:hypothetical protein